MNNKNWEGPQLDALLEEFLRRSTPVAMPANHVLAEYLRDNGIREGTTEDAVDRQLWGVSVGYNGRADRPTKRYEPSTERTSREGLPWTKADDWVLRNAFAKYGAHREVPVGVAHVAAVLARTEQEIKDRAKQIFSHGLSGFFE